MEATEEEGDDQDSEMGVIKMGRQKMEMTLRDATELDLKLKTGKGNLNAKMALRHAEEISG